MAMLLPEADQLLEDIYTLVHTAPDTDRTEAARIGKLAIQYRLNHRRQQRIQQAIDKRQAEKALLRTSGGGNRSVVGASGLAISSSPPVEGELQ